MPAKRLRQQQGTSAMQALQRRTKMRVAGPASPARTRLPEREWATKASLAGRIPPAKRRDSANLPLSFYLCVQIPRISDCPRCAWLVVHFEPRGPWYPARPALGVCSATGRSTINLVRQNRPADRNWFRALRRIGCSASRRMQ
jgi:hypothetical protein